MVTSPMLVTLANSPAALRVASFSAALVAIATARAVQTTRLCNVFDAEHPGTVAVYVDTDDGAPVALIQRGE